MERLLISIGFDPDPIGKPPALANKTMANIGGHEIVNMDFMLPDKEITGEPKPHKYHFVCKKCDFGCSLQGVGQMGTIAKWTLGMMQNVRCEDIESRLK